MVQKFSKNDADENKFIAIWEGMLEQTFADLEDYFENVDKSPALGNALWEANAVEVWGIIEKNFFVKIFDELIKAGYNVGSVDSYCQILYALFGEETEIEIVINSPLELTINVTAEYENLALWLSQAGEVMLSKEGDLLFFKTFLTDIPFSQLQSIVRAITSAGTKITLNLN